MNQLYNFMMHVKDHFVLLTVFLITSSIHLEAKAWGGDGHQLVCSIAENNLSARGKSFLNRVVRQGESLKGGVMSFPESCLWPDKVKYSSRKDTYEHHFLNVPRASSTIDLSRDCPHLSCLPVGIQRSISYLVGEPGGERERGRQAAALRYLGHYIGDLHQPLHVSNKYDWGGNKIKVRWFGKNTNLHSVWDREIMAKINLTYPESLTFMLAQKASPGNLDVMRWMGDSLHLARENAYKRPNGKLIVNNDELGDAYFDTNKPVVIQQLLLAGHRLAMIINEIAAGRTISVIGLQLTN
ncbi:MAG: S1/P1 nuclease [Pseudomonadales bacterium]